MPSFNDITGERFGRLIAIEPQRKPTGGYRWLCQCDCGNTHSAPHSTALITGHTQSCGCQRTDPHRIDKFRDNPLDHLKELLHYDPDTGLFTNLIDRGSNAKSGTRAGYINDDGYVEIKFFGQCYRAHRLAWLYTTGEWPNQIDHINHDRADNRWCNIRNVDQFANQQNIRLPDRNTSGFIGVCFHKKTGRWQANITCNRNRIYIGLYDTVEEAAEARKSAEIKYGFHRNHGVNPST